MHREAVADLMAAQHSGELLASPVLLCLAA